MLDKFKGRKSVLVNVEIISSDLTKTKTQGDALYVLARILDGKDKGTEVQYVAVGRVAKTLDNWIRPGSRVQLEIINESSILSGVQF